MLNAHKIVYVRRNCNQQKRQLLLRRNRSFFVTESSVTPSERINLPPAHFGCGSPPAAITRAAKGDASKASKSSFGRWLKHRRTRWSSGAVAQPARAPVSVNNILTEKQDLAKARQDHDAVETCITNSCCIKRNEASLLHQLNTAIIVACVAHNASEL